MIAITARRARPIIDNPSNPLQVVRIIKRRFLPFVISFTLPRTFGTAKEMEGEAGKRARRDR